MRLPSIGVIFTFLLFLSLSFSACSGDTTGQAPASGAESFTFGGALYVTNNDGSLLAFDPLSTNKTTTKSLVPIVQDENILPSRRFPESVSGPTGIFLDRANDTLYVANTGQNAISIYENASTLASPFSATRVISGNNTLLDQPFGITFDATNNRIFVANKDGNSILVFEKNSDCVASLSGNISPCRRLVGDLTTLDVPRALAIDTTRNNGILYISNMGNDSILVYDNASTLGAPSSTCITDFTACNQAPSRVISPHTSSDSNKQISKLELPFGIFSDSLNNRLYVTNTGLNTPGVFIYENASLKDGAIEPERVIAGINTPDTTPAVKNITDLTVPTGIDVDVATGQVYVINNNSPNNVNQTTGNVDSPSLIVFNDIDTTCTAAMPLPCNIAPNRRIGGDVSAETAGNTTLSSPTSVAFDPIKNIIYIANTGDNNIFIYAFSGDISPLRINASVSKPDNASIEEPSDFHFDAELDRLFVTNFGSAINTAAAVSVLVYDKISTLSFSGSQPSWSITGRFTGSDANFFVMRGIHIDKGRGLLLTLNAASIPFKSRFVIYCIPNATGGFNANCPTSPTDGKRQWFGPGNSLIDFPTNDVTGPTGLQLQPPTALFSFEDVSPGGTTTGPTAMEVDEASGDVYISDRGSNSILVYNLDANPPALTRTITGGNTELNKPHGLSYDATRNILYVANAGNNTLISFNCAGQDKDKAAYGLDKNGVPCTNDLGINGNAPPDRTVTTTTLPTADQLLTPIAPQIDTAANILYLISSDNNAVFVYNNADQIEGETSPSKKFVGSKTLFDFTPPQEINRTTGALLVAEQNGSQAIFVGQPESPLCTGAANTCPTGALLIFGVGGEVAPNGIWSGSPDTFTTPTGIAVDTERNVLYVTNQSTNALSIFQEADQLDVSRGTKTDFTPSELNSPVGLFVDTLQNRLYVSNSGANEILAFNDANTLDTVGTTTLETITHAQLSDPRGVTVDTNPSLKRLYVANTGGNSVLTFTINGNAALDFVLSGSNTLLVSPVSVAIDTLRDDLYVLNNGATEILVFEDVSTNNGDVAPSRIISGSDTGGNNFMTTLSAIFIDAEKDLLYATDRGSDEVYFFSNASTASGQAEHTSLSGDNTGLKQPTAFFVDITP